MRGADAGGAGFGARRDRSLLAEPSTPAYRTVWQARRRYRGAEAAQQRQRVEVDGNRAVRERLLQRDAHEAVRTTRHPLLRDRRTEDVLEESLATRLVEAAGAGRRVEREPIERDAKRPLEHHRPMRERQRAATPLGTCRRRHARDRRRPETRQTRALARLLLRVVGARLEKTSTAILVDAPHHGARHDEVVATMPDALSLPGHYVLLRLVCEARDEVPALVDHALALGHRRVAIGGVSFGAFIALAAATIDPRLAAIVSILGSPDWTPRDGIVPEDLADVVRESPLHRAERFAPRPLLLLNGALDDNVRPAPARALAAKLRPLYDVTGAGPLVHTEYPSTTHFPSAPDWNDMWRTAARFVATACTRDP